MTAITLVLNTEIKSQIFRKKKKCGELGKNSGLKTRGSGMRTKNENLSKKGCDLEAQGTVIIF